MISKNTPDDLMKICMYYLKGRESLLIAEGIIINTETKDLNKHKRILNNLQINVYYTAFMCISKIYKDISWLFKYSSKLGKEGKDFINYFIEELNKDKNLVYSWKDEHGNCKSKGRLIDWRDKKGAHIEKDFDFNDINGKLISFKDIKELYIVTGALIEVVGKKYNIKFGEITEHITGTQELINDIEKGLKFP